MGPGCSAFCLNNEEMQLTEFAERATWEKIGHSLAEIIEHSAAKLHGTDDTLEAVHEHHIRSFNSDITSAGEGNSNIGFFERLCE